MDRYKNKIVKVRVGQTEGAWYKVSISRLIVSWRNAGGRHYMGAFEEWLKKLGLDEDTICDVRNIANNGKFELEHDAKKFIDAYDPNTYRESNIDKDIIEQHDRWFERYYKIP